MLGTLYTFGYAGLRTADDVAETLGDRVTTVVDIRYSRWSRNPTFSQRTAETIDAAGYGYEWAQGLGNAEYRTGGMRLADPSAVHQLTDRLDAGESVAILCVCADATTCHRTLVSDLAQNELPGLRVVHL